MRKSVAAIAFALFTWSAAAAEPKLSHIQKGDGGAAPEASSDCSLGVTYDDGGFLDFYGMNAPAYAVMKFDLPTGTTGIDQVCSCFSKLDAGSPPSLQYDVVVYDNNGPDGIPGTFLGSVAATASSIPVAGNSDFYSVSLANSGIVLPDNSVYVGVRFSSANHLVCGDRSATTAIRPVYQSTNGSSWANSTTSFSGSGPNAWGIRVDPAIASTACVSTADELCLNGGRFKVKAIFDASTSSGTAHAVKLTNETGYFWFFSPSNVETVVKVIDGCAYNNSFWFFAGGLTNVQTIMTVTDTTTGVVRTYTNPQGTAFQPIQDTSAFTTCP
ncbi:MAG: hypothetical protein WC538_16635 [Thermoanaerobaculia bacterium]|jgi:hypothetical protein